MSDRLKKIFTPTARAVFSHHRNILSNLLGKIDLQLKVLNYSQRKVLADIATRKISIPENHLRHNCFARRRSRKTEERFSYLEPHLECF